MKHYFVLLFFSIAGIGAAEDSRVGGALKFGVPYTGWFQQVIGREHADDRSNFWMLGPALEVRLTDRLAIEASGLYRRVGRDAGGGYSFYPFSDRERGYAWEFPVVGNYKLPLRLRALNPFVSAGPSFEWQRTHTDSLRSSSTTTPDGQPIFFPLSSATNTATADANVGFTAGFGIQPKLGPVRLIMESRYTRWFKDTGLSEGQSSCLRCVEPNQGVFLVGIGF